MENLVLVYLLSVVIGIAITYYTIKMAIKNGIEAANKAKEPVVEPTEEEKKKESLKRDILIGAGFLVVLFFLHISGALA